MALANGGGGKTCGILGAASIQVAIDYSLQADRQAHQIVGHRAVGAFDRDDTVFVGA